MDLLGNRSAVGKTLPFHGRQHNGKLKKNNTKNKQKKKQCKVPGFPVTVVVFVPSDSIKCNFGTRHKPRSVTEEENFTRTPSGLLGKRREKDERGGEKKRKEERKTRGGRGKKRKRQREKKGNLV